VQNRSRVHYRSRRQWRTKAFVDEAAARRGIKRPAAPLCHDRRWGKAETSASIIGGSTAAFLATWIGSSEVIPIQVVDPKATFVVLMPNGRFASLRYMPICRKNKVTMPSEQCLSAGASPLQTTLDGRLKLTEQQSSAHVIFMDEK
jgi:hypothetical protein